MLSYKQKKNLAMLDVVTMVIAFLGVIVTTALVILIENEMRNVFLGELIILIIVFANNTKKVGKYLHENRKLKKEYSKVTITRNSYI